MNLEESMEEISETRTILRRWIKRKVKEESEEEWQKEWDEAIVGRWTHRLIPDIKKWKERKHGEMEFYLTQALTGHGSFNSFRKRIGKTSSDQCWFQCEEQDTPEHTLLHCQKWREERRQMLRELGTREEEVSPEGIIQRMLEKESAWKAFAAFCRTILKEKEVEERRREKLGLDNPETRDTRDDPESSDPHRE